jgi:hypothetical protein
MSSININYGSNWNVGGNYATTGTQTSTGPTFNDQVVNLGGIRINFNYTQDSNYPALPRPNDFASNQLPQQWGHGGSAGNAKFEAAFYESFSGELQRLVDGPPFLSQAQVQTMVWAHMTGEPIPDDTFLNDLLGQIEDKVGQEMIETYGEDAFPSIRDQAKALKGGAASTDEELNKLQDYVNSLPEGSEKQKLQQYINQARGKLANINRTLAQLENATDRNQFSALLQQLKDEAGGLKEHLGTAHSLSNDPQTGSVLSKFLSSTRTGLESFSDNISVANQNNELARGNWSSVATETGNIFESAFNTAFEGSFETELAKHAAGPPPLSEEEVAQLRFAHFNPEAEGIDPSTKERLAQIHANAANALSSNWGIPPGFTPNPDNTRFNAEIESAYDDAFNQTLEAQNLQELAQALGMSEEEVAGLLEYLHNNPDLMEQMAGDNELMRNTLGLDSDEKFQKLQAALENIEGEALNEIAAKYGLPPGYKVKPNTVNFNARMNGLFAMKFNYNLKHQEPPLTQQQINDIKAALADPLNPNVTAETRTLIQQIYNQSVSDIRAEYNMPVGWAPPVTVLGSLEPPPALRAAVAGIENLEESLGLMATFVDAMPDSPAKALMINILKIISDAISHLKEQIAELQILDAEISKLLSEAAKDKGLFKVELQMDKIQEMKDKKAKMAPLMNFMKIFGPIMKVLMMIIMIVMAAFTGGASLVLAAVLIASMIQEMATGNNFLTQMFEAIMKDVPSPWNIVVSCLICAVVAVSGGVVGIMMAMDLFFSKSGIIQEIVKQCGGDEMAGEIANMVCQLVAEIVLAIILTIITGGAAGAVMVGAIVAKAAQMAANILTKVAEVLERVSRALVKIAQVIEKLATKLANFAKQLGDLSRQLEMTNAALKSAQKAQKAAETAGDTAKAAQEAANVAELTKVQTKLMQQINDMVNLVGKIYNVFTVTANLIEGVAKIDQARIAFIQADLARILAEFDAEIEQLETLIKLLRQLMNKIMEGMQSQGEWLVELGNLQSKMWTDLSTTASAVAGANEG